MLQRFAALLVLLAIALPSQALEATNAVRVTPLMKTTATWDGKPISFPAGAGEATMLIVEIAPGGETGWHEHPVHSFAYLLEGNLEVTLADGRSNQLKPGDSLAEVVGVIHNGRVIGTTPVRILVVYTGAKGQALTTPHPEFRPAAKN